MKESKLTACGIGIPQEAIKIGTVAGCLIDLENYPEMTYGEKAKVICNLVESFNMEAVRELGLT